MKIQSKLLTLFLLFIGIPPLVLSFMIFFHTREIVVDLQEKHLEDIRNMKTFQIRDFFQERKIDAEEIQDYTVIRNYLPNHPGAIQEDDTIVEVVRSRFRRIINHHIYRDIFLTDQEGRLLFRFNSGPGALDLKMIVRDSGLQNGFKEITFGEIFFDRSTKNYLMPVGIPLLDKSGNRWGSGYLIINMASIYEFIQDTTGLGRTGETLIGTESRKGVLFLNPLRHDREAALRRWNSFQSPAAQHMQYAALKKTGIGFALDYRGESVLAAWTYIPELEWGLVTKIDTREIFLPVYRIQQMIVGFLAVFGLAAVLLSIFAARKLSRPVFALKNAAKIVGTGDLSYRIKMLSRDEWGELAESFNRMAENLQNVTASKEDLEKIQAELRRSNEALEQFAYVASHDLKEPLGTISIYMDLLKMDLEKTIKNKETADYLKIIQDSAVQMREMINGLLAFARAGSEKTSFENVDCNEIVNKVLKNLARTLQESAAEVRIEKLPMIYGNPPQLASVFQNLISNAVKFRRDGIPPRIVLTSRCEKNLCHICIEDNGIGISARDQQNLFKMFQRFHGREFEGTGIGLAVTQKIIERHGGTISVTSSPGKGTAFYFTLPLAQTSRVFTGSSEF